MKDYLAIIRKLDFVDLFKYGQHSINYAVPFDGDIIAHRDDSELFDTLTCRMNMYEYSFEYLIIHFESDSYNDQYITIDITSVRNLYTFNEEAKKEMSISFDPRIELHVSPWAEKFDKLQQKLSIKQSMRGVNNLWTIFDLPKSDLEKCKSIISNDVVQEVFRELYAYERPVGDQSIWTYLLRYERHSFYPEKMKGFFCDFIHVYCNYLKKQELEGDVAETTELYPKLKDCQKQQFASLLEIVKSSSLYQKTEQASGCRFAIAAPLFLFLKAQFADGMEHTPPEDIIKYSKEIGGFECSVAIYLLGLALGHSKTYDAFYESAQLSFFQKQSTTSNNEGSENNDSPSTTPSELPSQNGTPDVKKGNDNSNGPVTEQNQEDETLISDTSEPKEKEIQKESFPTKEIGESKPLPILWMKKNVKGRIVDVKPVFNEEEQSKKEKLGYEPVKKFVSKVKEAIKDCGYDPEEEKTRLNKNKKK